ncbi:MAG: DUF4185 domain-containing protein [Bacteroidales bacterium]|nr:DUF4185 domain-containing protein [Bacteroidales bacterium]
MKTSRLFIAIAACAAAVACQEEVEDRTADPVEMTFDATIESPGAGLELGWSTGDAISVYDGKKVNEFIAQGSGSSTSFAGIANKKAEQFVAINPYTDKERYLGAVETQIPSVQAAVKNGVDASASIAAAYVRNEGSKVLNFKNMLAYLKVSVNQPDEQIVKIQVSSTKGEVLAGYVNVGLFEEPVIAGSTTKATSTSVAVTGEDLDGTYYIAVMPQVLEGGYEITITDAEDSRWSEVVSAPVEFKRNEITDLGTISGKTLDPAVNPNPTTVVKNVILKASFQEGEFNMVDDGGFEYWPRTTWALPGGAEVSLYDKPISGKNTIKIDVSKNGGWWPMFNVVAIRAGLEYTYETTVNSNTPHTYTYVQRYRPDVRSELGGPAYYKDWSLVEFLDQPNHFVIDVPVASSVIADVGTGAWWDADRYCYFDDVKLYPKGYDKKSMDLKAIETKGQISNTTFDAISGMDRVVAWNTLDGDVNFVFSKPTIGGQSVDNAFATCLDGDITTGLAVNKYFKKNGSLITLKSPVAGVSSIVPDAVFTYNGKTYMHYYAETAPGYWRDDAAYIMNIVASGFAISEDNGKTWTLPSHNKMWTPINTANYAPYFPNSYNYFAQASFVQKDGVIYMIGCLPGRFRATGGTLGWKERERGYYCAKCDLTKDFTNPDNWQYWNGLTWVNTQDEILVDATLTANDWSEMQLVWNPKFKRWMMIYRSEQMAGLVYRDSDVIEGPWSGVKLLTKDEELGKCFAPSVLKVDDNGDIWFIASQVE